MRIVKVKAALFCATSLGLLSVTPALAQDAAASEDRAATGGNDIIVTARRVDERLQDVPISISVLNPQQLANNNISNMKDLAAVTPGLQINSRYGSDASNFSIRGFTQEQRTYATVGTYFADVVAPRGSGGTFGGDGAGPGSLFDLDHVEVLKGPQGTLQGRNSTGGAVLLVPKKPTGQLEGYAEGSIGDYSMRRIQAVVNVPLADTFRVRLGFDRMTRHGYLNNIGLVGDGVNPGRDMGDVNYYAGRLSVVGDLTPNLESYLVATYSHSKNNGVIPTTVQCFPRVLATSAVGGLPFGDACVDQRAREAPYGPWTVENRLPTSQSTQQQWQIIHALTWQASDSLTIKNIMSYGEFRSTTNLDLYGNYFVVNYNPAAVAPTPRVTVGPASGVTSGNQVTGFAFTSANPFNGDTNAQSSFVEELRFQYHPDNGKLMLQGGLYAELNNPIGPSGVQTATLAACADIQNLNCAFGSPNFSLSSTKFRDYAVYSQGTYSISDKLKFTAGLRYTWDKQISDVQIQTLNLATQTTSCTNTSVFGIAPGPRTFPVAQRYGVCHQALRKDTSAPTWLLGLDYKPTEDVLLYAKYSRGYRQGGLSLFSPDTTQSFDKERVDTYEVGAKTSWRGSMPGSFNISGFYNKFANQQLLLGVTSSTGQAAPSASVVNAGKSYMLGFETELNISPFEGFHLGIGYAYLKTKLQAFVPPTFAPGSFYDQAVGPLVGGPIPNSIPHKLTVSANYTLPLDASIGKITLGGTFIYTSAYQSVADGCPGLGTAASPYSSSCYGANFPGYPIGIGAPTTPGGANVLNVPGIANPGAGRVPGSKVINLSVNWENVAQLPVDASFFMTNVTNEVVYLNVNENTSRGFRSSILGEPRMFGFRLKYRFGN